MILKIKSLGVTEASFSSSMTNCSTSAASCWELKSNGAWRDSEILRVRAHKNFGESTSLLDLNFISMFKVKDEDSDGTLFQSDGKTLSAFRMVFAQHLFPFLSQLEEMN